PGVVELGPVPASSPWPLALREGWPGRVRPLAFQVGLEPTATVVLDGSFDAWLAGRGAQFRKAVRRRSRAFERDEGVFRLSTPDRTAADIATFVRLHEARWAGRGDSRLLALGPRLPALLGELAASLGDGRFRLWLAELDGEPVCADLSIVAGGEVVGVNTGWDERFKRYAPVQLATVHKLRDCWARRERRLDMGWGSLEYKRAFADGNDPVAWYRLVPVSRRLPRAVGAVAPAVAGRRLRQGLRRALPAEHTGRLRALQDRARVRRSRRGPS
ncbi:MAG: GNAT family N-acetyltransferase, partial [Thermoleophilaceae bacterium]|nr:GNAT family N-acetyltransferase [Thermoleophilaceae bacterium]